MTNEQKRIVSRLRRLIKDGHKVGVAFVADAFSDEGAIRVCLREELDGESLRALHRKVLSEHHDQPDTLVLDELGLCYGTARVDVAVINGRMHGFEIKSDRDTLERLPEQSRIYSDVLDRVTLVVGETHMSDAQALIPEWWGIKLAYAGKRGAVHFRETRPPMMNPNIVPLAVASLLWCSELTDILSRRGVLRGLKGKPRDVLTRRVAEILTIDDLRSVVRETLKSRTNWRANGDETNSRVGGRSELRNDHGQVVRGSDPSARARRRGRA